MANTHETKKDLHFEVDHVEKPHVHEEAVASVALARAVAAAKPKLFTKRMLQLYFFMAIGYLISTMNGFDSSLMGGVNAMPSYQKTFNLPGAGSSTGIIFIIYNCGQIAAFPFCGMLADGFGRRKCVFIGCAIVLVGTAVQVTANLRGQFIAGRFLLGFGAAIASAAGPAWIVELAHPAFRGTMAGLYNNFWWFGNIIAGWATYGANKNLGEDSWAWRTPTLVQCGMPAIVMLCVLFFPESPRWLIAKDRAQEALAIFVKYHGEGDTESPLAQLQYNEVIEDMAACRDENPWWDFRELVNTRAARYRLSMVIAMAFFGQWSGNNVVGYFMPEVLKEAGITDVNKQLVINAIGPIFAFLASVYGATLLDKRGRRFMMLGGLLGSLFSYILLTAFIANTNIHPDLGYGTIVAIYLFLIFFSWGWTPLQTLYPVECLTNRMRAKGSGANFLFLNIAMVVNTFGASVAIERIGWKLYVIYDVWLVVEILVVYFFFVETAGKTLEELAEVFQDPHPVQASLRKTVTEIES